MKTPSDILDFVGLDRAQEVLKVGKDRIRTARDADKLPASWYNALETLAGRPLPREAFTFKGAA
jgi:hypothetical protein